VTPPRIPPEQKESSRRGGRVSIERIGSPRLPETRTFRTVFPLPLRRPPKAPRAPRERTLVRNPVRVAREWHQGLRTGLFRSRAELARKVGVSRARVSQLLRLLRLAPRILLAFENLGDPLPAGVVTERRLRQVVNGPVAWQTAELERTRARNTALSLS